MRAFDPDTSRFYYLNNSGSRGIRIDADGNRERITVNDGATIKPRAVLYWQACGNYSFPVIRLHGKRVMVFTDNTPPPDGSAPVWSPYEVRHPGKTAH